MQVTIAINHEDLPHLLQVTANVYQTRITYQSSYAYGKHESIIQGERDHVDRLCCVAADVQQRVSSYLRGMNDKARLTLQENRKV